MNKSNIIMIHQPHFLPWPPYFIRALTADVLVILDDVKFNKDYYQNRTKLKDDRGVEFWFTIPVDHSTRSGLIKNVRVSDNFDMNKVRRALLSRCSFLIGQPIMDDLHKMIEENVKIADINIKMITYIIRKICETGEITPPKIVRNSTLFSEADMERTDRLIKICEAVECGHIIMGSGSQNSHETERIRRNGIKVTDANNHTDVFSSSVSILQYFGQSFDIMETICRLAKNERDFLSGGVTDATLSFSACT